MSKFQHSLFKSYNQGYSFQKRSNFKGQGNGIKKGLVTRNT